MTMSSTIETTSDKKMRKLLDDYDYQRPQRGDFMDAEVMQIEHDRILVDLGAKTDAVIPPGELKNTDEALLEDLSEGDIVPVYIMHPPTMLDKPKVSLQRGMEKSEWARAEKLLEEKKILHLEIVGKNKGGLLIKFGRLEGFLPASLMPTVARSPNREIAEKIKLNLIGEKIYLTLIEVKPHKKKLIFSAREQQEKIKQNVFDDIHMDEVKNGIVVNLVEYGAFVDLLGVDGLLHISNLDWVHQDHPSDVLSLGEKIEVKIIDVDEEKERIGLSRKALLDPIEAFELEGDTAK